ncbi:hypothetical protein [Arthrobacter sp. UM1]|uniref:hypothetical protein n=1 Tax=Arthrobacter sp. UM1 TaxID=2766776 RepID=UPI001CF68DBD|nr:hypothetical protein [Arthrobacter sp. UM1]MCB4209132.1 hypothetical protein [Arthrobacter sp. UM1]
MSGLRRPAWAFLAVGLGVAAVYIGLFADPADFRGHREAAGAFSALLLLVSGPLAAASSAVEGGRVRGSSGVLEAAVRPPLRLVWGRIWPGFAAGAAVQCAAFGVLTAMAGPAPDGPNALLAASLVAAVLPHAAAGHVLGLLIRQVFAVPGAVLLSYLWIAFAWTLEPLQLRYMAGPVMALCCTPVNRLDPAAPLTLLVVSLAAAAGFAALAAVLGRPRRAARSCVELLEASGPAVCLVLALAAGMVTGRGLGVFPTVPIGEGELLCRRSDEGGAAQSPGADGRKGGRFEPPEVCATAVQLSEADRRPLIAAVFSALEEAGLPRIRRVVSLERPHESPLLDQDVANVFTAPDMTEVEVIRSAAATFAHHLVFQRCPEGEGAPDMDAYGEFAVLSFLEAAWALGHDDATAEALRELERLELQNAASRRPEAEATARSEGVRAEWLRASYAAMSRCKAPPTPAARS